jgi:hypothetical protein
LASLDTVARENRLAGQYFSILIKKNTTFPFFPLAEVTPVRRQAPPLSADLLFKFPLGQTGHQHELSLAFAAFWLFFLFFPGLFGFLDIDNIAVLFHGSPPFIFVGLNVTTSYGISQKDGNSSTLWRNGLINEIFVEKTIYYEMMSIKPAS